MREYDRGYLAGYAAGVANLHGESATEPINLGNPPSPAKKKRKVSAYSKRYGAAYKRLKAKHPRMSFGALSKKAHKEARRK